MDAHRKTMACLAIIMMLLCMVPIAADGGDDPLGYGQADGVLLYEVNVNSEFDGVSLYNYGGRTVDVKGYTISDGEGTLEITGSLKIEPGKFITIASGKSDKDPFTNRGQCHVYNNEGTEGVTITKGSFNLGNGGDDVYLYGASGKLIDAVFLGSKEASSGQEGWTGPSAPVKKGFCTQRTTGYDTDSADDWFVYVAGRTDFEFDPNLKFDATVTPFLFPDSGGIPVFDAVSGAEESVCIMVYQISNTNMYALLCDLAEKGVEVKVLVEGGIVGGMKNQDISKLRALSDAGADVRVIGHPETDNHRYAVDHAKFAIVDNDTVVMTSENWAQDNLNGSTTPQEDIYESSGKGNRGWGAIIESVPYAGFMAGVFDNDFSMEYGDVKTIDELYPDMELYGIPDYKVPGTMTTTSYHAKVTPVLSPDNSYEAMEYYISNAEERVYAEQQSLGEYYTLNDPSPISVMAERARAGVDVRFILSGGINEDGPEVQVETINMSSTISAAIMDKPYVHNKGLICDDIVWVDSINWTDPSFNDNRESCAVIESEAIADYFAEAFLRDFEVNYTYDGFSVDISGIKTSYPSGSEIVAEVKVSPASDNYTYHWDFGDGVTIKDTTEPRTVATPLDGAHVLTVTVTNSEGKEVKASVNYYIGEGGGIDDPDMESMLKEYGYYILPLIVIIIGVIGAIIKKR